MQGSPTVQRRGSDEGETLNKSKKFLQKNCKVACSILDGCYYNRDQTANELCKRTGITKQKLDRMVRGSLTYDRKIRELLSKWRWV